MMSTTLDRAARDRGHAGPHRVCSIRSRITGVAQAALPRAARTAASSPTSSGEVVGSELIGQALRAARLLPAAARRRPARTATTPRRRRGSNLGPDLAEAARPRRRPTSRACSRSNPDAPGPVPAELVTASASGLDPHLSPAGGALAGAARRHGARGVAPERVPRGRRGAGRGARPRLPRRAARERAAAQPRARPAVRATAVTRCARLARA